MAKWKVKKPPTRKKPSELPSSWWGRFWSIVTTVFNRFLQLCGLIALVGYGWDFMTNKSGDMWPYISVTPIFDQPSIFDSEFTFTNEAKLRLYNVEVVTQLLLGEMSDGTKYVAEGGEVFFLDDYNSVGSISGQKSVSANIARRVRNELKFLERRLAPHTWTRFAFCFNVEFQIFPLYLLPLRKQSQKIGYLFDQQAGIEKWRQRPCEQLLKMLPQFHN